MSTTTFHPYDLSNSETDLHERAGQVPVTVEPLEDHTAYDVEEVGPMYRLTFADGFIVDAFADELRTENAR